MSNKTFGHKPQLAERQDIDERRQELFNSFSSLVAMAIGDDVDVADDRELLKAIHASNMMKSRDVGKITAAELAEIAEHVRTNRAEKTTMQVG